MNCIKVLRSFYVDAVCWFLCILSNFLALALRETHSGNFLVTPLMIVSTVSTVILAIIYGCEASSDVVYVPLYHDDDEV